MILTALQYVVPAVLVLMGVGYTQRQIAKASQRTAEVEASKVDGAAYERARLFDNGVVERIQQELNRAYEDIASLRATIERERSAHATETQHLRQHIDQLENTVGRLSRQLRNAGLDVELPE